MKKIQITLFDSWNGEYVKVCRLKVGRQVRKLGVRLFRGRTRYGVDGFISDDGKYSVYVIPMLPCGSWAFIVDSLED